MAGETVDSQPIGDILEAKGVEEIGWYGKLDLPCCKTTRYSTRFEDKDAVLDWANIIADMHVEKIHDGKNPGGIQPRVRRGLEGFESL